MKFVMPIAVAVSLCVLSQTAIAQTPEMPMPQLVVKDADGKVVARIAGWDGSVPLVILNIDGIPALFEVSRNGLQDHGSGTENLFYTSPNCTGGVHMKKAPGEPVEEFTGVNFAVYGPDPTSGEYVVYRSSPVSGLEQELWSEWHDGRCNTSTSAQLKFCVPALEVVPNPLAAFHGPTGSQPERYWTISGGDTLP